MEELKIQLSQIFNSLRTQDQIILQNSYQARQAIIADPNVINALISIISDPSIDTYIRTQASINFLNIYNDKIKLEESRYTDKSKFQELVLQDKSHILHDFLSIIPNEQNNRIQAFLGDIAREFSFEQDEGFLFHFLEEAMNFTNPLAFNSALKVASEITFQEHLDQIPLAIRAIERGIHIHQIEGACELAISLSVLEEPSDEITSFLTNFWIEIVKLIPSIISEYTISHDHDVGYLFDYITGICSNRDSPIIDLLDTTTVITTVMPYFGSPTSPINTPDGVIEAQIKTDIQFSIQCVMNCQIILQDVADAISESDELINTILDRYIFLSASLFNPDDSYSQTSMDIFSTLGTVFSESEKFSDSLFSKLDSLLSTPQTRVAAVLCIAHSLGNYDAYRDQIQLIVDLFCRLCSDDTKLARDVGAFAISQLAQELQGEIDDFTPQLATALFTLLRNAPTSDSLEATSVFLEYISDSNDIFEDGYPLLMSLSTLAKDSLYDQQNIIKGIAELCVNATTAIQPHFEEIYSTLRVIVQDPESPIIDRVLEAIHSLARSCKAQFLPHIVEYTQFLMSMHDNFTIDLALTFFTDLIKYYYEAMSPIVPSMIAQFLPLASTNLTELHNQEFKEIQDKINAGEDIITEFSRSDDDDYESKLEAQQNDAKYQIPSHAILFICTAFLYGKSLITPENLSTILDDIELQLKLEDYHIEKIRFILLDAIEILLRATNDIPMNDSYIRIIKWCINIIDGVQSIELVGQALMIFSDVIGDAFEAIFNEEIKGKFLEIFENFLDRKLPCQLNDNPFPEELLEAMEKYLSEFIEAAKEDSISILAPYFQKLNEFMQDKKSKTKRKFGLVFYGKLVEECGQLLPNDILQVILASSISIIRRDKIPDAVYAIDQFASGAPAILNTRINEVLEILMSIISSPIKKAKNSTLLQQLSVAALGELVRNGLLSADHEYLHKKDFVAKYLNLMPSVEDPTINYEIFKFLIRLYQLNDGEPADAFVGALSRLFVLNEEEMSQSMADNEDIPQLIGILKHLLQTNPQLNSICNDSCLGQADKAQRLQNILSK